MVRLLLSPKTAWKVSNLPQLAPRPCVFEYIYFSDPTALLTARAFMTAERHWPQLALESAVPADVVIPVPDSGAPLSAMPTNRTSLLNWVLS